MRQKLNLITLGVSDVETTARFYESLGWKRSEHSTGDLVLFPLGGITMALYPRHLLAEDAAISDDATGFAGVTFSLNTKSEEEVDSVLHEVQSKGATIVKPAQKVFWGGYSGYFKDPDGHLVEIAFNPFWELDKEDNLKL
ncbi:VOC family protein [Panacibacter sp. DH6]|uniref:VOC family protein n=1 Tax=Panacibacter microcysteis TaxID=2793269 RepID=A0A931E1V4_9BACT|nr:VOC family protein [Panacibacter microcysteis]MBG9375513.1 VOC family protein [Panacibacter microcysteis]